MALVLIATDDDAVFDEVEAALLDDDVQVLRVRRGNEVRPAVDAHRPEVCVLDLQIGNMGGMAVCMDLRHEAGMGRLEPTRVLMLLDRDADEFLARRCGADGWLVKPLDSFRLRKAVAAITSGESYAEGA